MDSAYISTISALAGTLIGAISTFATSWMTQAWQARTARLSAERMRRDELYSRFLEEVSRLYSHAVAEDRVDYSKLVAIYAVRGRILLQSSDAVIQRTDEAIEMLKQLYLAPNRSAGEIVADAHKTDPMTGFAKACREELAALR